MPMEDAGMPAGVRNWTRDSLDEIKARLEKDIEGHGSLPLPGEDLVAEAMLRLIVASARRPLDSPLAYARMILLNLVRDHIRELERTRRALDELAVRLDCRPPVRESNRVIEEGELVKRLLDGAGLSPLQERVLERLYFGGLTISELARELGRNPGTVLRHHDRAIEKLSRCACRMGM
jgi:RNA polymerase sigma factor (sigma-70 family)